MFEIAIESIRKIPCITISGIIHQMERDLAENYGNLFLSQKDASYFLASQKEEWGIFHLPEMWQDLITFSVKKIEWEE